MNEDVTQQLLEWVRGHYFGKYRGTVTDNSDPTNRGRVRVNVPSIFGGVDGWAMPCAPYAGQGMGAYQIPETGTGVWVEFEAGDPSYPVWTGCFWGDSQLPDDSGGSGATPSVKILRTKSGMIISIDDDAQTISVTDGNENNFVKVTVPEGLVKVQGNMKVVVDAPQIELVENATHPLVFGDDLLEYLNQLVTLFNTHTHPGELALGVFPVTPMIAVPPFPPATPALLSVQVKNG